MKKLIDFFRLRNHLEEYIFALWVLYFVVVCITIFESIPVFVGNAAICITSYIIVLLFVRLHRKLEINLFLSFITHIYYYGIACFVIFTFSKFLLLAYLVLYGWPFLLLYNNKNALKIAACMVFVIIGSFFLASYIISVGTSPHLYKVERAQRDIEKIEEYHTQHGYYPKNLEEIAPDRYYDYVVKEEAFELCYTDYGGFGDYRMRLCYDSQTGQWSE